MHVYIIDCCGAPRTLIGRICLKSANLIIALAVHVKFVFFFYKAQLCVVCVAKPTKDRIKIKTGKRLANKKHLPLKLPDSAQRNFDLLHSIFTHGKYQLTYAALFFQEVLALLSPRRLEINIYLLNSLCKY